MCEKRFGADKEVMVEKIRSDFHASNIKTADFSLEIFRLKRFGFQISCQVLILTQNEQYAIIVLDQITIEAFKIRRENLIFDSILS